MQKTSGGWGETFPKLRVSYFRVARFNTSPLYSLRSCTSYNTAKKITFSCGTNAGNPSGQDGPILPTRVTNQNAGFACPLVDSSE